MSNFSNQKSSHAILESWKNRVGAVDRAMNEMRHMGASNIQRMDEAKKIRLAQIFENTKRHIQMGNAMGQRLFESTQVPDIGPFKLHAFDMIAGLYPTMISDELVSIQAMPQKLGQVFFRNYNYGSTRGSVNKGDSMLSAWTGAADYNNYSGERITDEVLSDEHSIRESYELHISNIPVRAGTFEIDADGTNPQTYTDNGKGQIVNQMGAVAGTIDYNKGLVTLGGAGGEGFVGSPTFMKANYFQNLEHGPTQAGEVNLQIDCATLNAVPHKLRATWAFDAGYDLQMSQGLNIEDELIKSCTAEIRHERDGLIISSLYNQAANASTWNRTIPIGISQREHYESFVAQLHMDCNTIFAETKRSMGNWVVCGKQAIDILNTVGAPRFVANGLGSQSGPHFAGTVDGMLKVYFDPFLPSDAYLVGYKGQGLMDAGYIVGDYLPIFVTQTTMLDDFVGRKGFVSIYATKLINSRMYVSGSVVSM